MRMLRRRGWVAALGLVCSLAQGEVKSLLFRTSAQREVAPVGEIVDGRWIVIGNGEKAGGRVVRDTDHLRKRRPVYRFSARDDKVNRIEFSEVYGSAENLKGLSKEAVADALALKDAYFRAEYVGQRFGHQVQGCF